MGRRRLFLKSRPCSRSRFRLTASPSSSASFTDRRLDAATVWKTSRCAISTFLARRSIPVPHLPPCSASNCRSRPGPHVRMVSRDADERGGQDREVICDWWTAREGGASRSSPLHLLPAYG